MKNTFNELKKKVGELDDIYANNIIELLEEYNNGLSHYFKNREISREFLKIFDIPLTLRSICNKFEVTEEDIASNMSLQQLVLDLNFMARSTWYFEKEDGKVLTGENLYQAKAVFMASNEKIEKIYNSEEEKKEAKELWDYVESVAYWGSTNGNDNIPKPIGYKEIVENNSEYKEPESVDDMCSLIQFHAMSLQSSLKMLKVVK